jgi:uncharacterized protein (DUF302 family)
MNASLSPDDELVTLPSAHGVNETVNRLRSLLAQKGIQVFAQIDHAAEAQNWPDASVDRPGV